MSNDSIGVLVMSENPIDVLASQIWTRVG